MLNHITLMGRITRDIELRYTNSGKPVTSFSVACERDYGAGGQRETDFFDVVAWNQAAEFASKYFAKGQLIALTGRLQTRDWQDQHGNKRRNVEVLADHLYFADSKTERTTAPGNYSPPDSKHFAEISEEDGSLPF